MTSPAILRRSGHTASQYGRRYQNWLAITFNYCLFIDYELYKMALTIIYENHEIYNRYICEHFVHRNLNLVIRLHN